MSNYSTSSLIRFFLMALLAFAGQALSGQKIWTNGNSTGVWSDPGNWDPSGVPTSADTVRFNNTSDTDCTIDIDAEASRLVIAGNYNGNVDLGSNTLTLAGNFVVTNASQFTAGMGSKVIIAGTGNSVINSAASVYDLEINKGQTTDNVAVNQDLTINNDLTITQVNNVNGDGNMLKVSADIILNDADLTGNCYISANGACTITGTQLERLNVAAGASLQLLSDITLTNNFSPTGGGTITGSNTLILGSNGNLDFSGTVSNVEINTSVSIHLIQDFNVTGDLDIIQINALLGGMARELRVGGDITVTDDAIIGSAANAATLVLAGSGTNSFQGTSGGGYRHLAIDKDNASDVAQLNSSDEFFSITVKKGILDLNGQNPEITNTSATINSGGTLAGNGTIDGTVVCGGGGKVSLGNSVGTITINGNFTSNGTLEIEIERPGSFDQIIVNGDAEINGNISITFLNGYAPLSGEFFEIIGGAGNKIGTATVTATNAIIVATYSGGTLTFNADVLLPVELMSFEADPGNTSILLSWLTATEQNNDYMAVERSADGIKFEELGRVKGAGTTEAPQEYRFVDDDPIRGLNYYRLRQVDFDGAFEYHKTISVLFESKSGGLGVQAWPNPAQASLQARWSPEAGLPTSLRVFDVAGRLLAEHHIAAGVDSYEILLNALQAGLYFLQMRHGQEVEVVRFRRE